MDISPVLTISLNDTKIKNDIGIAVLAKHMDTEKQIGAALIEMIDRSTMENSVNPKLGGNIDISL